MYNSDGESSDEKELEVLYAYEEELPRIKTKEEILAENLAALKAFDFPPPEQPENDSSGKMAYLEACRKINKSSFMNYPTSTVVNELGKLDSETLDLSFSGLAVKGSFALAASLRVNTNFANLVLVGNSITPSGGLEISKALLETRTVTFLDLSVNLLGEIEVNSSSDPIIRGGAVINELLSPTSSITSLYLRKNRLTDGDVTLFAETLSENLLLTELDLSYNNIGFLGALELSRVIARNADLHHINLEWNKIPTTGSLQLLSEGFLHNNTIKLFNLSACGIDDTCAPLLNKIMSENAIEEIIIANNRLSGAGADALAKGIINASSLTKIVLDGNPLMDAGCEALLQAVINLGDGSSFHHLSLLHCGCTKQVAEKGLKQSSSEVTILISEGLCKVGYTMDFS